jgi:hypothetical protein
MRTWRRTFKATPCPFLLGLITFGLSLWALWAWLPPTPVTRIHNGFPWHLPICFTEDGLLVTQVNRANDDEKDLYCFWNPWTGQAVQLKDEKGRPIEQVTEMAGGGRFLKSRMTGLFHRTGPMTFAAIPLPGELDARNCHVAANAGTTYTLWDDDQLLVQDVLAPGWQNRIKVKPHPPVLGAGGVVVAPNGEFVVVEEMRKDVTDTGTVPGARGGLSVAHTRRHEVAAEGGSVVG